MITLNAKQCPAIQQPASMLSIANAGSGNGNALVAKNTLADIAWRTNAANPNATMLDRLASEGGANAFALSGDFPPILSIGAGLLLNISAGEAIIGGPVQVAAGTLAVPNNTQRVWIWMSRSGTLVAVATSTTPPAGQQVLLGSVTTSSGVVTAIDTSGVLYLRGGVLWRQTADSGAPTDTPPSTVSFIARTAGGVYLWDGAGYTTLGPAYAALSTALSDAQDDLTLLKLVVKDLIRQLVNMGLDDILSGATVAAAYANDIGTISVLGDR